MTIEILLAICAVLFTFYQAWLSRHHNRLSVMPHLQWSHHRNWTNAGLEYRLVVQNYGLGPARIKNVDLFLNDAPFVEESGTDDPLRGMVTKAFTGVVPFKVKSSSFPKKNYLVKADGEYSLLVIEFPGLKEETVPKLEAIRCSMDLRIAYESFYGDPDELDTRK